MGNFVQFKAFPLPMALIATGWYCSQMSGIRPKLVPRVPGFDQMDIGPEDLQM